MRAAIGVHSEVAFVWGYAHFAIFAGIAAIGVGAELLIAAAADGGSGEAVASLVPVAEVATTGSNPGAAIVAGALAAFWAGQTLVNLANLGFRVTPVARLLMASRVAMLALLIALAAWAELSPEAFMAVAAAGMVAVNLVRGAAVGRLQRTT